MIRIAAITSVNKGDRSRPISPLVWAGFNGGATLKFFMLVLLVLGSGLAVVIMTHQNRFLFNQLQQLRDQAITLEVEWGQLLIEQSTFGLEGRVEQKATAHLQLRVPELERIVMVTRD